MQTRTITSTQILTYTYDNANRLTNVGEQAYTGQANGKIRVDDVNGFRIEVHERDTTAASGSYSFPMPSGQSWRFTHWIYRNPAYIDNYTERADSVIGTTYAGGSLH